MSITSRLVQIIDPRVLVFQLRVRTP